MSRMGRPSLAGLIEKPKNQTISKYSTSREFCSNAQMPRGELVQGSKFKQSHEVLVKNNTEGKEMYTRYGSTGNEKLIQPKASRGDSGEEDTGQGRLPKGGNVWDMGSTQPGN